MKLVSVVLTGFVLRRNLLKGESEMKKSWKDRATALAKRVNALDERNDAVLRNQEIRELKGLLAYYPPPRSAREFRGEWVTVLYRLPSGGKTANIWTAVEKWQQE